MKKILLHTHIPVFTSHKPESKTITAKIFPGIIILLISLSSFSQWQQTLGPGGGWSTGLFAKGDTLYTGNYSEDAWFHIGPPHGTIYRSTNHGQLWLRDSTGFYGKAITFTGMGNKVFVGTLTDGIFRSDDNGNTWKNLAGSNNTSPNKILAVNGILFVGSSTDGVYRSTDNGNTFTHAASGLPRFSRVEAIGAFGNAIFVGVTSINGNGVYRSTNNGASWKPVNNGFSTGIFEYEFKIGGFASLGNKLFATIQDTVRVTSDLGEHWTVSNTGIQGAANKIVVAGTSIYVSALATGWSIYKSTNNGVTWSITGPGIPGTEAPFELVSIGNEVYAGLGYYGSVFRTMNQGASWEPANIGLPNLDTYNIFSSGNNLFAASLSNPGVHKSTDGGNTWMPSGKGLPADFKITKAITQNANYLFAGMELYGVYRSSDGGANWQSATNGLTTFGMFINSLTINGNVVFAGTYDGVFRSANNGNSWVAASPVVMGSRPEIKAVASLNGYVFAATPTNGIFRSSDNGTTWTGVNNGLHTSEIYALTIRGNDIIAGTMKGIYISTNNGASWTEKNNGLPKNFNGDSWARTVAAKGDTLFTALYDLGNTASMGIFISTNNGNSWTKYQDFPDLFAVRYLAVTGNYVYAATETESVWKNTISTQVCANTVSNTFTSNITSTSAVLHWDAVAGATSYQIQYGINRTNVTTANTANSSYTLTGLIPNTQYGWRVRAKCNGTYSDYSVINTFKTATAFMKDNSVEDAIAKNGVDIYPNPATNYVVLSFNSTRQNLCRIIITDLQGKISLRKNVTTTIGKNNINIDVSNLAKGAYILQIRHKNEIQIVKLVKQ